MDFILFLEYIIYILNFIYICLINFISIYRSVSQANNHSSSDLFMPSFLRSAKPIHCTADIFLVVPDFTWPGT